MQEKTLVYRKVVLTSGRSTDFYVNVKKLYGNPKALAQLASALAKTVSEKATCLAVSGHGGIPLGVVLSAKLKLPLTLVRAEKRSHGLENMIDGYISKKGDLAMIVDDVCTSGGSVRHVASAIRKTGAGIIGATTIVNRQNSIPNFSFPFSSLVQVEELL